MSPQRLTVSAFAAVMIAAGAVAVTVAVSSPSTSHAPAPYQDYLRDTGPGRRPVRQAGGAADRRVVLSAREHQVGMRPKIFCASL